MAEIELLGIAPDGTSIQRATIQAGDLKVSVLTWGATVQDVRFQDFPYSLVLGSPDLGAYLGPMLYFGAIVGRVANRIENGQASLDGRELRLERNEDDRTTLHGGTDGCASVNWRIDRHDGKSCRMQTRLPDGQGGFPGNLDITADFEVTDGNALNITLTAETDAPTLCNLAHHGYWCLDGQPDIGGHRLTIHSDSYLPVDGSRIPVGKPAAVDGSEFDFRKPRCPIPSTGELDHNFCLPGEALRPAALLETEDLSLEVLTTATGLQVYNGERIDTSPFPGTGGPVYGPYAGIALEPQGWPNAPNNPQAPSIRLDPGERYEQSSVFRLFRK